MRCDNALTMISYDFGSAGNFSFQISDNPNAPLPVPLPFLASRIVRI